MYNILLKCFQFYGSLLLNYHSYFACKLIYFKQGYAAL